jgi:molecular chaperone HscA
MSGCCKEEKNLEIVVGIDFGTTNCLIGHTNDGKSVEFLGKKALIPSQIAIIDDKCYFGNEVNFLEHKNIIKSIKRIIGLTLDEIKKDLENLPYKIDIENSTQDNIKIFIGWNKEINQPYSLSVEEIVFEMMNGVKNIIINSDFEKYKINAVITVPAYFDEKARNIIKKAAILAEINVLRLINEPTAAALAYQQRLEDNKNYLIYDLGGGTFDISIVRKYPKNLFRVMGIGGDKALGGDDFDNALANFFISKYNLKIDDRFQFIKKIKEFKENFQNNKVFIFNDKNYSLENEEFENILYPIIRKTIDIVDKVIEEFRINNTQINYDIDGVILVGGSTRLPLIINILKKKLNLKKSLLCDRPCSQNDFERKILCELNPDEVVAFGATIHSFELINKNKNHVLIDAISMSIGLEIGNDCVEKLILKNSPIPISKKQIFTTQIDNQKSIKIAICQGENEKFSENIFLGKFIFDGLPEEKAGFLEIEINFSIDADGILSIKAQEKKQNKFIFALLDKKFLS